MTRMAASPGATGTEAFAAAVAFAGFVEPPSTEADGSQDHQVFHLSSYYIRSVAAGPEGPAGDMRHRFGGHQQLPRWQVQFLRRLPPVPLPFPPPDPNAQAMMTRTTPIVTIVSIKNPPRLRSSDCADDQLGGQQVELSIRVDR